MKHQNILEINYIQKLEVIETCFDMLILKVYPQFVYSSMKKVKDLADC